MASGKWNNSSQYKKVNSNEPWFPVTKHTSSNEKQSGQGRTPKETLCPGIFVKSNYQQPKHPQETYNNPTCTQRPTRIYKQNTNFHPYNKTKTHSHNCNKFTYKFTGTQYSIVKNEYKWINPNIQKKKEEDKKEKEDKEEKSCTASSVASSSSMESS